METNKIKLLFISQKEKKDLIINKKYNIKLTNQLITSLNEQNKIDILKEIFIYKESNNYTKEEIITLFKTLSYRNKLIILKELEKDESSNVFEYLKHISISEGVRIINYAELDVQNRIYIVDNILPQETRIKMYKYNFISSDDVSLSIIKHLDESTLRNALKKRKGLVRYLDSESFVKALSFLPSVEEKISLLNKDNDYNLELTENQKIKLIMTTNDEERFKIITNTKIEQYKKIEVVKSLTEEGKMYFINNPTEIEKYFPAYKYEFYRSLSQNIARTIVFNFSNYKIDSYYIDDMIKILEPIDIINIMYDENYLGLPIRNYQAKGILESIPEEDKLELIKQNNKYNINLTDNQIIELISNMKPQNIIKMIIKEKEINLTTKDIWKIIESLNKNNAIYFLSSKDKEVLDFVNKYKTSFSKCLDDKDKVDIIYNRSKYGIHLEDERKMKILKTIDFYYHKDILEDNIFKYFDNPDEIIEKLISDKQTLKKLDIRIQEHAAMYLTKEKDNPDIAMICLCILKYIENSKEVLNNFEDIKKLLELADINILDFVQYGINSNKCNWDTIILNIIKNDKVNEFINIKQYFTKFYYNSLDKKKNIENFLELLNAYNKYETLCKNLTLENRCLYEEEKQDIDFLFKTNEKLSPININEIKNLRNNQIQKYQDIAKNSYNRYQLKNALLNLFFGKDEFTIKDILRCTGSTEDLNILKFNNRENKEYSKIIDHVILMTEFIERILNTNDIKGLKETLSKYTKEENIETTKKYINYCSKYEEYIRKIYETDINISLTKIDDLDESLTKTLRAQEMIEKYGGIVYDLSDSKYTLMAHVKSISENINNLLNGISDGNSNFICMSPASHRGQHYYAYSEYSVVFAYDEVIKNSFICSSVDNLGSNASLKYNTSEVPEFRRVQKGILETSEASSHKNAEMLLYREGLKPKGIIIPAGITPNKDAIEYHQKYNIPFILTQEIDKTIENPKPLSQKKSISNTEEYSGLEILKELKIKEEKPSLRQIAIITDPHALYEPTMACLIDIKNKGITEIYSLGDNIGHGPSPKETLELLEQYNVKSILGNHELYIIEDEAMEIFKNHLIETGALERTTDMTNWIKQELTKEQLEKIKTYPNKYEITLSNDKKITLIHTTDAYNKEGKYSEPIILNDSVFTIKGHKHFKNYTDTEYTLRAVGIGQTESDDGLATYAVLTLVDDEYCIDVYNIPYNRSNLLHTINESNMPTNAKSLIKSWVSKK